MSKLYKITESDGHITEEYADEHTVISYANDMIWEFNNGALVGTIKQAIAYLKKAHDVIVSER